MKKILIANGHLNAGGVEKSLINLLRSVDYSQYQVDLLLFEGLGDFREDVPEQVNVILCDLKPTYGSLVQVIRNNLTKPEVIRKKAVMTIAAKMDHRFIKHLLPEKEYDIAIAYRNGTPLDYVSYGVNAKKKYFWWHHGEFNYPQNQVSSWQKAVKNLDAMVCVSGAVRKIVEPYFKDYAKQIIVIPNSIDSAEIYEKAGNSAPWESTDKKVIVSVGRFSEEKHMADCVAAAEQLVQDGNRSFVWYLIGDGAQYEYVNEMIRDKRLEQFVQCTGRLANPYPYVRYADLLVHPSYVESQGLTVLEAMAAGTPIVCVGSDGVLEFAEDGKNCIVSEKSIDSLVSGIQRALSMNPKETEEMCAAGVKTASSYSYELIWDKVESELLRDE